MGNSDTQTASEIAEEKAFRFEQAAINRRLLWANVIVAFAAVGSMIFAGVQGCAARRAADLAAGTLDEMRNGSGAQDTHSLALSAIAQAQGMKALADAAKSQSEATANLAKAAANEAGSARAQTELNAAQALPEIRVTGMHIQNLGSKDKLPLIEMSMRNEGLSTATNVVVAEKIRYEQAGIAHDVSYGAAESLPIGLSAKEPIHRVTQFGPLKTTESDALQEGRADLYVIGKVTYKDFRGKTHVTPYCMQYKQGEEFFPECYKPHH